MLTVCFRDEVSYKPKEQVNKLEIALEDRGLKINTKEQFTWIYLILRDQRIKWLFRKLAT